MLNRREFFLKAGVASAVMTAFLPVRQVVEDVRFPGHRFGIEHDFCLRCGKAAIEIADKDLICLEK